MKVTIQEENGDVTEVDIDNIDTSVLIRQDTRQKNAVRVFMYNPRRTEYDPRSKQSPMFIECEHEYITLPTEGK